MYRQLIYHIYSNLKWGFPPIQHGEAKALRLGFKYKAEGGASECCSLDSSPKPGLRPVRAITTACLLPACAQQPLPHPNLPSTACPSSLLLHTVAGCIALPWGWHCCHYVTRQESELPGCSLCPGGNRAGAASDNKQWGEGAEPVWSTCGREGEEAEIVEGQATVQRL